MFNGKKTNTKKKDTDLGYCLGLDRLLGGIRRNALSLDPFCLLVHFIVRAKEIHFIVFLSRSRRGRCSGSGQSLASFRRSGECDMFVRVGLDVLVPACGVGSYGGIRGTRECLKDVHVSLRRGIPDSNFSLVMYEASVVDGNYR